MWLAATCFISLVVNVACSSYMSEQNAVEVGLGDQNGSIVLPERDVSNVAGTCDQLSSEIECGDGIVECNEQALLLPLMALLTELWNLSTSMSLWMLVAPYQLSLVCFRLLMGLMCWAVLCVMMVLNKLIQMVLLLEYWIWLLVILRLVIAALGFH